MNTDKIYGLAATDPDAMRQAMFKVLSELQDQPEVQVQATAMCLLAMCKALKLDMRRVLTSTERIIDDLDGPFVYVFRSVEEYARDMIGRNPRVMRND